DDVPASRQQKQTITSLRLLLSNCPKSQGNFPIAESLESTSNVKTILNVIEVTIGSMLFHIDLTVLVLKHDQCFEKLWLSIETSCSSKFSCS
ncbi:hypothetical protein, partial [Vibrio breoganii]|uniref:hypothetical protein n=1 Tax=Vibrio breoganii TaxID=553239 RepID=UPI001C2F317F